MKFMNFIALIGISLLYSCTPSQSSSSKSSDSAAIIIKKFTSEDYVAAFGADCANLNLATLASKSGLATKNCTLVDDVLNMVGVKVSHSTENNACIKKTISKPYTQNMSLDIALNKLCEYTVSIKIGAKVSAEKVDWILEGEKIVTIAELEAAPGGKLDINANLAISAVGEAYGFGPAGSQNPEENNPPPAGTTNYKVSFGGAAFSGGALTGEGMNCNRSTATICEREYPAGSVLNFEMPTVIKANGKTYEYGGQVICNDVPKKVSATGAVVKFAVGPLKSNQQCSFSFSERE